jgi:two-component system OmpR family sensor kinase
MSLRSLQRLGWLWFSLPFLVGIVVAALAWLDRLPNPILYMRADLGSVTLILGIIATLVSLGVWWQARRHQAKVQVTRREAATEHRRFLRRLDHELKNPLTAMRVGLANLAEGQERSLLLESVERETLRIGRLAADLRKLADVEAGAIEQAPVDISALLGEVVAAVEEQGEANGRTLRLVLPAAPWPLPNVVGDPDLLFLAVHNLVVNALKFSDGDDVVEVRAGEQGSDVVIEVADTGCGISNEEAPHIWDELYRGQGARGTPGSGLGLALVRAVVERHHGEVEMRSRVGQGSIFMLRLPMQN